MTIRGMRRGFMALLALCVLLAASGIPHHPDVQAEATHIAEAIDLPPVQESEPNDEISQTPAADQADPVGPANPASTPAWRQTITGTTTPTDDLDWYRFEVRQPVSSIVVTLTNLTADFDLVLASSANSTIEGDNGLSNILDVGRRARSTGRRARSTGRRARSTGSSVEAIGRRARSTGGDIAAFSAEPFTNTEVIDTVLWTPGTYYLAVGGENGAVSDQPYTLEVEVAGSGLAQPPDVPGVLLELTPDPDVRTLFITNIGRMKERYPSEQGTVDAIFSQLKTLASRPEVAGVVLDLGATISVAGTKTITETFADWDNDQDNPLFANYIAEVVDGLITAATVQNPSLASPGNDPAPPPFPNVESIVIVGGDEIIPFYRVPDLATVANEGEYLPYLREIDPATGIINRNSALGGALNYRTILTDNIYGDNSAYWMPYHPLFIPDRAVGRLVETPTDIAIYLQPYTLGTERLEVNSSAGDSRAVVTGYDFLADQAQALIQNLQGLGFASNNVRGLVNETWTANDLATNWFDDHFDVFTSATGYTRLSPFALQSINAHFDYWEAIPADPEAPGFLAQVILNAFPSTALNRHYFSGRLCYSVGCHSGLNVEQSAVSDGAAPLYAADFPQAYMRQGGNWIGNTGFGYGDADLIGYSERLSLLTTEELGRAVNGPDVTDTDGDGTYNEDAYLGQPIGMALALAKQRYLRNATLLDVHDIKALLVMNLYGLPFIRSKVATPQPAPLEEATPEETPDSIADLIQPDGRLERIITFTTEIVDGGTVVRTGKEYPVLKNVDVVDSFVEAGFTSEQGIPPRPRIITATQESLPVLPQFAYDLTVRSSNSITQNLIIQDVLFLGGDYDPEENYSPVVSQLITQDLDLLPDPTLPLSFETGIGLWYPDKFFDFSSLDVYNGADVERRDQLLVTPSQFKAEEGGLDGTMRFYEKMVFKVIYVDPGASEADVTLGDTTPPIIASVRVLTDSSSLQATSARVVAEVQDDNSNNDDLVVGGVYGVDDREWVGLTFRHRPGTNLWDAEVPEAPSEAVYIVTASDEAGNVSTFTGKGTFVAPQAVPLSAATIAGPSQVEVGSSVVFTATAQPLNATGPLTYSWSPEPESGQNTTNATYRFPITGTYTLTVDMGNIGGVVTGVLVVNAVVTPPVVGIASVAIDGNTTVLVNTSSVYTATILPLNATQPVSYTWTPTPTLGQGSAVVTYTWDVSGTQRLTVQARNARGAVTSAPLDVRVTTTTPVAERRLYLPVVQR